jgi:predicted permease
MLRWYRLLLRAFPKSFRARFGRDMAEVFADRLADARHRRVTNVARLLVRTGLDAIAHGLAERRLDRRRKRRSPMLSGITSDVAYALRLMKRRPTFTGAALLTIALGVGANVATFSIVRAVLLERLPYPEPGRLVHVSLRTDQSPTGGRVPRIPVFEFLQSNSPMLRAMAAAVPREGTLSGAGRPVHLQASEISAAMPEIVGLPPVAGRGFVPDDYRAGSDALLISDRFWRSYFGSDRAAIGRRVRFDTEPRTIVGVMPEAFDIRGAAERTDVRVDVWLPLIWLNGEGSIGSNITARLPEGVDLQTATRAVDRLMPQIPFDSSAERAGATGIALVPLEERGRAYARPGLHLLQGVAALFLVLACANLANLLLVESGSRRREIGIRAAAGAGRWRLVRQTLTEAAVMACCGGLLGIALASAAVPLLVDTASWALPRADRIGIRWIELSFGFALALVTTMAAAVVPAWIGTQTHLVASLRTSRQVTAHQRTRTIRAAFVAIQVAVSLTILATAGVLIHSFSRVVNLPLGFDPHGVVIVQVPAGSDGATSSAQVRALSRLHAELSSQFSQVAVANSMPYTTSNMGPATPASPSGRYERFGSAVYRRVSPEYFEALRIPIVRGRPFTEADRTGAEAVVIVNETFVREFGPGGEIVGTRMRLGRRDVTVVGVAGDTRNYDLTAPPQPAVHWPIAQQPAGLVTFAIRGSSVGAVASGVERVLSGIDPDVAPWRVDTLESRIRYSLAQRRFFFLVFLMFAVLGAALAGLGVYAVTAHAVQLRARELAIRLALGSTHHRLEWLAVRQGFVPVAMGIAAGLAGAWCAGESLSAHPTFSEQLYQVTSHDTATLAAALATTTLLGAAACWLPARRIAHTDPASALRLD